MNSLGAFLLKSMRNKNSRQVSILCFPPPGALNAFLRTLQDSPADLPEI